MDTMHKATITGCNNPEALIGMDLPPSNKITYHEYDNKLYSPQTPIEHNQSFNHR